MEETFMIESNRNDPAENSKVFTTILKDHQTEAKLQFFGIFLPTFCHSYLFLLGKKYMTCRHWIVYSKEGFILNFLSQSKESIQKTACYISFLD